jgi:signal transduction histidine kinase/CheY-like chemotaxis protein
MMKRFDTQLKRFFDNFLTAGHVYGGEEAVEAYRIKTLVILMSIGAVTLIGMSIIRFEQRNWVQGTLDLCFMLMLAGSYLFLRRSRRYFNIIGRLVLAFFLLITFFSMHTVSVNEARQNWLLIGFLMFFFWLGRREGLVWSIGTAALFTILSLLIPELFHYSVEDTVIILMSIIFITGTLQWYECVKEERESDLIRMKEDLERRVEARTRDLSLAKAAAEQSAKVKSEFLANMSHEIRTPMNAVIGMTYLALESGLDEKQRNYIQKANTAAKNLLGIINDILDVSKIESGKLELHETPFEFKELISSTLSLIKTQAVAKELKTRVIIDRAIPGRLIADSLRLGQILTNIGNNAVKFSEPGGTVTLRARLVGEGAEGIVVEFAVEDEGIGISEADQEKLFRAFSQVDGSATRRFGGTGLGLVISKKLVELMGGTIWLESEAGKGSTFYFTVRALRAGQLNPDSVEADAPATPLYALLEGKRILVVEDNELNQEVIRELLEGVNISVTMAENGREAVEMIGDGMFDAVLMDCHMPVMDGYEATRILREKKHFNTIPIIALTASVMDEDVERALESGMNDHVAKPIVPDTLFETLEKWLQPGR